MSKNTQPDDLAAIVRNQAIVQDVQGAMHRVGYCFSIAAAEFEAAIQEGALAAYLVGTADGWKEVRPSSLRSFIESPWPDGCGSTVEAARRALVGSAVAERFEAILEGAPVSDVDVGSLHRGNLANNGTLVLGIRQALSTMPERLELAAAALRDVIAAEAWKSFATWSGKAVAYSEFGRFLSATPPQGCGVEPDIARKVAVGSDLAVEVERLLAGSGCSSARNRAPATGFPSHWA